MSLLSFIGKCEKRYQISFNIYNDAYFAWENAVVWEFNHIFSLLFFTGQYFWDER